MRSTMREIFRELLRFCTPALPERFSFLTPRDSYRVPDDPQAACAALTGRFPRGAGGCRRAGA